MTINEPEQARLKNGDRSTINGSTADRDRIPPQSEIHRRGIITSLLTQPNWIVPSHAAPGQCDPPTTRAHFVTEVHGLNS